MKYYLQVRDHAWKTLAAVKMRHKASCRNGYNYFVAEETLTLPDQYDLRVVDDTGRTLDTAFIVDGTLCDGQWTELVVIGR